MNSYLIYQQMQSGRWAFIWDGYRTLDEAQAAIQKCATPGEASTFKITRLFTTEEDVMTIEVGKTQEGIGAP